MKIWSNDENHPKSLRRVRRLLNKAISQHDCCGVRLLPYGNKYEILDLGANVGIISIASRFLHPTSRVMAIEPVYHTYNILVENISNLYIETYNMALGNGDKVFLKKGLKSCLADRYDTFNNIDGISMNSYRLTDICNKLKINVNMLYSKIDCEGVERFIIDHIESTNLLKQSVGFYMELHIYEGCPKLEDYEKWLFTNFNEDIFNVKMFKNRTKSGMMYAIRKTVESNIS